MTPPGVRWQACSHAVAVGGQLVVLLRKPW
jgi:hypothetical protein